MKKLKILIKIVLILVSVAYFTIAERKIMASVQRRRGPNVVGIYGLLQPLADGLKLIAKKLLIPTSSNKIIFLLAPLTILSLSLVNWSVTPFFSKLDRDRGWDYYLFCTFILICAFFVGCGLRYAVDKVKKKWGKQKKGSFLALLVSGDLECGNPIFSLLQETEIQSVVATIPYNVMFLLALSSLNVYAIIIAGWASNSKYAFLGSLRSAAQMISYEVSIGLVLLPVVLLTGKMDLTAIVLSQNKTGWFLFPLLPCFIIFFISMLAETNRTPFDLPEAEAELVAGYNVEYSSIIFAMFFLGEYSNMLLMSTLMATFFCGGWLVPVFFSDSCVWLSIFFFSLKITFFCFLFILVRATLPRYKYSQLMSIGWKIFLPLTLSFLMLWASFFVSITSLIIINNLVILLTVLWTLFYTFKNRTKFYRLFIFQSQDCTFWELIVYAVIMAFFIKLAISDYFSLVHALYDIPGSLPGCLFDHEGKIGDFYMHYLNLFDQHRLTTSPEVWKTSMKALAFEGPLEENDLYLGWLQGAWGNFGTVDNRILFLIKNDMFTSPELLAKYRLAVEELCNSTNKWDNPCFIIWFLNATQWMPAPLPGLDS